MADPLNLEGLKGLDPANTLVCTVEASCVTGFEPMALEEIQASVGMGEGSIKGTIIISFHSCTCILAKRGLGTAQNDTYDLARKLRKMLNKYGRKLSSINYTWVDYSYALASDVAGYSENRMLTLAAGRIPKIKSLIHLKMLRFFHKRSGVA